MTAHQSELMRQHEAHKARQAALWGKKEATRPKLQLVKPEPIEEPVSVVEEVPAITEIVISTAVSFTFEPSTQYEAYPVSFDLGEMTPPKRSMRDIAAEVLKNHPYTNMEEVRSQKRSKHITLVRHLIMYEIHNQRPDASYPEIGRFMRRDHTSIIWGVIRMKALLEKDPGSVSRIAKKDINRVRRAQL